MTRTARNLGVPITSPEYVRKYHQAAVVNQAAKLTCTVCKWTFSKGLQVHPGPTCSITCYQRLPHLESKSGLCSHHAASRLRERYGLAMNVQNMELIHRRIQSGKAKPIKAQPNDAGAFIVEIQGQQVGVVYGIEKFLILTILPSTDLRVCRE